MGKEEIFNYVMETPGNTNPNVLRSLLDSDGGGLPTVSSSDNGKVLAVKDGEWAAKGLNSSGRAVQIEAEKVNGAYTATTQLTSAEVINGVLNGYAFQLFVGSYISEMQPLVSDADTFVIYKATLQTQETVIVTINGLDEENAGITIEPYSNKFIVTLTPTALDYSGTMDKTPAEITAAYNAGQEIMFDIPSMNAKINATQFLVVDDVIRAGGMVFYDVNSSPVIITVITGSSASTYLTQIFAMTPAS